MYVHTYEGDRRFNKYFPVLHYWYDKVYGHFLIYVRDFHVDQFFTSIRDRIFSPPIILYDTREYDENSTSTPLYKHVRAMLLE